MFQVYSLRNEYQKTNMNADYNQNDTLFSFTNEGKKDVEIHSISIFIKSPDRIKKSSYILRERLKHGINIIVSKHKTKERFYLNGDKKPIRQFDDYIKYGFEFREESFTLNNPSSSKDYKVYRFTKTLPKPIILNKKDSFDIMLKDDMTYFIDHKVILDLFYN